MNIEIQYQILMNESLMALEKKFQRHFKSDY